VFTARYALSPYIKQIHFVFKGLRTVGSTAIFYIDPHMIINNLTRFNLYEFLKCLNLLELFSTVKQQKLVKSRYTSIVPQLEICQ
jgi:hypothetical protein